MRIITILLYAVTVIACLWVLIRLAARGICETVCDPGHSPWEYGQWVIAPKWPFILFIATFFFLSRATTGPETIGWGFAYLFWTWIWVISLVRFKPLSKEDDADYGDADDSVEFPQEKHLNQ